MVLSLFPKFVMWKGPQTAACYPERTWETSVRVLLTPEQRLMAVGRSRTEARGTAEWLMSIFSGGKSLGESALTGTKKCDPGNISGTIISLLWLCKLIRDTLIRFSFVVLKSLTHAQLFATPWTVANQHPLSMGFPGKSTRAGCHFLLQRILPTQGSKLRLLRCILYHWTTREARRFHHSTFKLLTKNSFIIKVIFRVYRFGK